MNQRILYNIASRARPEALRQTLDNIIGMSTSDNYELLVKLDVDDNNEYGFLIGYVGIMLSIFSNKSKIQAINHRLDESVPGEIVVNLSDDQRFTVKGFDNIIREHCAKWSFLHFPCDVEGRKVSVMSIMSRDYYEERGYIYHPDYYSMWCDNEETERAKENGAYKFIDQQIFEHLHYSNGKAQLDPLYRRNRTYKQDREIYLKRKATGFPKESVL